MSAKNHRFKDTVPEIIFEDDDIVVVNKPSGVIVHRAPGYPDGSLADMLLRDRPGMSTVGSKDRPGVVHRLDRDTSGVMVFAKTRPAYLSLRKTFENHERVKKIYLAILHGSLSPKKGSIDLPIGRKPWDSKRMAVNGTDAKTAITHWNTIARHSGISLTEFTIETGRTHQIRVHAAHLGHPIAGDPLYGDKIRDLRMAIPPRRQLLHAAILEFPHPRNGKIINFTAAPPPDIVYAR